MSSTLRFLLFARQSTKAEQRLTIILILPPTSIQSLGASSSASNSVKVSRTFTISSLDFLRRDGDAESLNHVFKFFWAPVA